jgi:hypothetical protein
MHEANCTLGDGQAVSGIDPSKVRVFCNPNDNICDEGPILLLDHFLYFLNADEAASFVLDKAGF